MVHAGGVGSKYHEYWAGRLPHIQAQLQLAAAGERAVVSLPGLTRLGTRQSWHGVAEVRAQEMTYSSMAHATSLGKTVAASALCGPWPERVFRFTIDASGDVLTITRAEEHRRREASPAPQSGARPAPAQRQEKSQSISRAEPTGGGVASGMDSDRQSDIDEFYRILDQLPQRGGSRAGTRPRRGHGRQARHNRHPGHHILGEQGRPRFRSAKRPYPAHRMRGN